MGWGSIFVWFTPPLLVWLFFVVDKISGGIERRKLEKGMSHWPGLPSLCLRLFLWFLNLFLVTALQPVVVLSFVILHLFCEVFMKIFHDFISASSCLCWIWTVLCASDFFYFPGVNVPSLSLLNVKRKGKTYWNETEVFVIEKHCVCCNGVIKNAFQFKYDHSIVHLFFFFSQGR